MTSATTEQIALGRSHAGMRLIAQLTAYNRADFTRLRAFLTDGYHAELLTQQRVSERLAALRMMHAEHGRLRVHQVIVAEKYHVVVIAATERGSFMLLDLTVEEDYPHHITGYTTAPLDMNADSEG